MGKGGSVPVSEKECCNARRRAGESRCRPDGRDDPASRKRADAGSTGDAGQVAPLGGRRFSPAGSVTCSTSSATRSSWPKRGRASGEPGHRTPGIDGVTAAHVENGTGGGAVPGGDPGPAEGRGIPAVAVRQVMIPKTNGKLRKIGIPTVADRVVQASLKLVLDPSSRRISSRLVRVPPGRRAHDAIAEIHHFASRGYTWYWRPTSGRASTKSGMSP